VRGAHQQQRRRQRARAGQQVAQAVPVAPRRVDTLQTPQRQPRSQAEEPTRRAVLADITCDSDGKIDRFIDKRDVKEVLELHPLGDDPYYLGIFLVGAYQEILGDLHNLFGDTNDVQVTINGAGGYFVEHVLAGDTVNEVLSYVAYNKDDLVMRLRRSVENALREGRMTLEESKVLLRSYEAGLAGYTYLEREG
jgi:arginine decarboxylase